MTTLWLNNLKVFQNFGQHPERGRRIKGLGNRTTYCGIKWVQFAKKYKPNPMGVCAVVALKRTKELGFWEVVCEPQYRTQVENWLIDKCR